MASAEEPPSPAALLPAATELRRAMARLSRRLRTERSPQALSTNKLLVLGYLYRHGPATPGRLAAAEHHRPQSLTRVFAELEQDGLVVRGGGTGDRRQVLLTLTAEGRQALAADMAERDAWLAEALTTLGENERDLLRIAARVLDRLADAEPDAGAVEPDTVVGPERPQGEPGLR
jgi:DNA-binding MarR family transcriptional regulator